jgi:phthalate 4,5-dioxygenase oxygenase subunit
VESMGRIQDRTVERLGVSDRAVSANRRLLLRAIAAHQAGTPTPALVLDEPSAAALRGPLAVDTVTPNEGWQERWREAEAARRARSPWAAAHVVA